MSDKHVDPERAQFDAFPLAGRFELRDQSGILDHVCERLAGLDFAVEGQEDRAHRIVRAAD